MWKQVAYPNLVPKCSWTHASLSRSKKEIVTPWHRQVWPISSGVEQRLDKAWVGGSRPPLATKHRAVSIRGIIPALHVGEKGSSPLRSTMLTRVD